MTAERFRRRADGVAFAVRLTPKGGRDAIEGWAVVAAGDAVLKARVAALPEKGKANKALIALLAETLGVPRSSVRLLSGESARLKAVLVEGDPGALSARLEMLEAAP